jgi:hypothetical protein
MTSKPESFTAPIRHRAPPRFMVSVPVDDDLSWFINHAESAQGARAFAPTKQRSGGERVKEYTWSRGDDADVELEMTRHERRLLASKTQAEIAKASTLRQRWQRLGPNAQRILVEAYGIRVMPRETEKPLGSLAGVALLTSAAAHGLPADAEAKRKAIPGHPVLEGRGEWLLALCRHAAANVLLIDAMRAEAAEMVRVALAQWQTPIDGAVDVEIFLGPERKAKSGDWAPDSRGRGKWRSPLEQAVAQYAVDAFAATMTIVVAWREVDRTP